MFKPAGKQNLSSRCISLLFRHVPTIQNAIEKANPILPKRKGRLQNSVVTWNLSSPNTSPLTRTEAIRHSNFLSSVEHIYTNLTVGQSTNSSFHTNISLNVCVIAAKICLCSMVSTPNHKRKQRSASSSRLNITTRTIVVLYLFKWPKVKSQVTCALEQTLSRVTTIHIPSPTYPPPHHLYPLINVNTFCSYDRWE